MSCDPLLVVQHPGEEKLRKLPLSDIPGFGLAGLSAYQLALLDGYKGTLSQWLASLKVSAEIAYIGTKDLTPTFTENRTSGFGFNTSEDAMGYNCLTISGYMNTSHPSQLLLGYAGQGVKYRWFDDNTGLTGLQSLYSNTNANLPTVNWAARRMVSQVLLLPQNYDPASLLPTETALYVASTGFDMETPGGGGGTGLWDEIIGKPETFPPSSHSHLWNHITDRPTALPANGGNADTLKGRSDYWHTDNANLPTVNWAARRMVSQVLLLPQSYDPASLLPTETALYVASTGFDMETPGGGGTGLWDDIIGKPETFPPSPHSHLWNHITDRPTAWAWSNLTEVPSSFAPSPHSHLWNHITDRPTSWAWSNLTGVPSSFTPTVHSHSWSQVTGKPNVWTDSNLPDPALRNIDNNFLVKQTFNNGAWIRVAETRWRTEEADISNNLFYDGVIRYYNTNPPYSNKFAYNAIITATHITEGVGFAQNLAFGTYKYAGYSFTGGWFWAGGTQDYTTSIIATLSNLGDLELRKIKPKLMAIPTTPPTAGEMTGGEIYLYIR